MARSTRKESGERARKILAAADELFGEQGFDAVSVRDVAEHAGVNKALVFYYFGSKDELFERVVAGYYGAHEQALRDAFEGEGDVRTRLHRLIDAYIDYIAANRNYPRLVQQQVASNGPALELIQRSLIPMQEWVEAALVDVAPREGPLAARQFFVTFSGAVINYFTYADALAPAWGSDPASEQGVDERRAHLHWLVDAVVDKLEADA
ncbi:MAG: TetR/AcrR family transcriptional regulator [Proteobacteria bacterium]|nr:TetR/AcrR family transcriptional regulator [Pseudomonadota bacterium]MCP4916008.1 TetR/AcrR family transcriptional regulator [Pseudomonadota bacterium]